MVHMRDRDINFRNNTIKWSDFAVQVSTDGDIEKRVLGLVEYLNRKSYDDNSKPIFYLSFLGRSIVKLQSLGVIQTDFVNTLGTISLNNIDRIHITVTGQEILKYIKQLEKNDLKYETIKDEVN